MYHTCDLVRQPQENDVISIPEISLEQNTLDLEPFVSEALFGFFH